MRRLREPVLRLVFRVGYRVLRVYWLFARPRKRGVKCVIARGEDVLLVRHTYGRRHQWELPGGGVKRGESPLEAARREIKEELGLELNDWSFLGDLFFRLDGKRDTLSCFRIEVGDLRLSPDAAEIAETRWFNRAGLPPNTAVQVARIAAMAPA